MPLDSEFLQCIQEIEADLDESGVNRKAWRKAGAHLIRLHNQYDELQRTQEDTLRQLEHIRDALFDPSTGVIAQHQLYVDRHSWAVKILAAVGAVVMFLVSVAAALAKFWKQ